MIAWLHLEATWFSKCTKCIKDFSLKVCSESGNAWEPFHLDWLLLITQPSRKRKCCLEKYLIQTCRCKRLQEQRQLFLFKVKKKPLLIHSQESGQLVMGHCWRGNVCGHVLADIMASGEWGGPSEPVVCPVTWGRTNSLRMLIQTSVEAAWKFGCLCGSRRNLSVLSEANRPKCNSAWMWTNSVCFSQVSFLFAQSPRQPVSFCYVLRVLQQNFEHS